MNKPVEPKKEFSIDESFEIRENTMEGILEVCKDIKQCYPNIPDNEMAIVNSYDEFFFEVSVIKPNVHYESQMRSYLNDMKNYDDYLEKEKLKEEAIIRAREEVGRRLALKREMKEKQRAARLASKELKDVIDTSIVEIDNKKYKVVLIEE